MSESIEDKTQKRLRSENPGLGEFFLMLAVMAIVRSFGDLTGWRDEWEQRTAIGRVGFAASRPLVVGMAVLMLAIGIVAFPIGLVFYGPSVLYTEYRNRAYKNEVNEE